MFSVGGNGNFGTPPHSKKRIAPEERPPRPPKVIRLIPRIYVSDYLLQPYWWGSVIPN